MQSPTSRGPIRSLNRQQRNALGLAPLDLDFDLVATLLLELVADLQVSLRRQLQLLVAQDHGATVVIVTHDTRLEQIADRVLYLDCDTVVLGDVRELWEMDLEGQPLAAAVDYGGATVGSEKGLLNYRELGLPAGAPMLPGLMRYFASTRAQSGCFLNSW